MSRLRGMYGTDPRALFTIRVLSGILLMFDIEMRAGMLFFDWYQMEMFYGPDGVRPTLRSRYDLAQLCLPCSFGVGVGVLPSSLWFCRCQMWPRDWAMQYLHPQAFVPMYGVDTRLGEHKQSCVPTS